MFEPSWRDIVPEALRKWTRAVRVYLRILNGDDAYARYLAHSQDVHETQAPPLDRRQFFQMELERRWNGVRRCC